MVPQLAHRQNTTQVSGGICSVFRCPQAGQVIVALYLIFMVQQSAFRKLNLEHLSLLALLLLYLLSLLELRWDGQTFRCVP